jgi:hypothetical protein
MNMLCIVNCVIVLLFPFLKAKNRNFHLKQAAAGASAEKAN